MVGRSVPCLAGGRHVRVFAVHTGTCRDADARKFGKNSSKACFLQFLEIAAILQSGCSPGPVLSGMVALGDGVEHPPWNELLSC